MKYFIYLLLFVSSLSIAQSKRTTGKPAANSYFVLDKTTVRFENNFFSNYYFTDSDKKHKNGFYWNLSDGEYFSDLLGKKINIKITVSNEYNNQFMVGSIFIDNLKANKDLYKIENLEIQVLKNNKILKDWTLVTQTKKFSDSVFSPFGTNGHIENGYIPYTDSLINGDKLVVLIRKKGQKSFLKWNFEKKEGTKKPFVIIEKAEGFKNRTSLENFMKVTLDQFQNDSTFDDTNLYDDWPEDFPQRVIGNRSRHYKNEKFCLVFRKPNRKKRTYDSFEYRINVNSEVGEWTKSNGIIFIESKEPGTQYKLEVRYKDDPKHIAVYRYYTAPAWYQALWFKIVVGMFSLLIFSLVYIFWMKKVSKRKQLEQKSKIKMLYAQLNPHFVFNALGSIQGLLNDNQIEKANQYLAGFGSLLRSTLTSSEKETQSLETEIKTIKNYIELEQLRSPFSFRLTIDEKINVYETQTLPLLIQPLIENAIKHGISNKENAEIILTVSKKQDDLLFELADNGKGFDTLAEQKGFGLKLVKDRITLFNQSSKKMKIEMRIQSDLSGTQVSVFYKNWLKND
ncbi:sensor histidine kinase [Flavobacterium aquicola]|uniref:Histidine kinase n=1 Tax=Flavobacterium aquicola TaxID=1682742 RepID=A0A3E0ERJ2_9FLAO|nr:histidine kinase [Flavobacterium aquicola]REH00802.1 histidine kinase [Flavobacterium aquicola]